MKSIITFFISAAMILSFASCVQTTHSIVSAGNGSYSAEMLDKDGKRYLGLCTAEASGDLTCTKGKAGPTSALNPKGIGFGDVN